MTNPNGRFGIHGGQYIPETLMNAVKELEEAYNYYKNDPEFNRELTELLNDYAGRPSRLYYAEKMTKDLGGAKIYLKREDLNHTGAHKINNVLGQALLAKKMGKTRLIAETGAGQHGVALATACALVGIPCEIHMGEIDIKKELYQIKDYIAIEQARFGDKLTVIYDNDEEVNCCIPSVLLQPLVENAIVNGIQPCRVR